MSHRCRRHRYITAVLFAGLLLIGGGSTLLQSGRVAGNAFPWTCAAVLALSILTWRVRCAFAKESGNLPDAFFPGLANQLTVFRGLLICLLAGFLVLVPQEGLLAWMPGSLYSMALIMDGFDGYLARLRKETTIFGVFLDRDLDALETLIGILLAVHYSRLPNWCMLAGISYYLFSFGEWWRARRGLPLYPLPESRYRRYAAVVQSIFIAFALLPVSVLPEFDMAAALVMIPVLAGFLRDWRIVAGYDRRGLAGGPRLL